MRDKLAIEEAASLDVAKGLVVELSSCATASTLRSLLPRLQSLSFSFRLQESCSIFEALTAAAKRCRKSKDEGVLCLLSAWGQVLTWSQEEQRPRPLTRSQEEQPLMQKRVAAQHGAPVEAMRSSPVKRSFPESLTLSPGRPIHVEAGTALQGRPLPKQQQQKLTAAFFGSAALTTAGG